MNICKHNDFCGGCIYQGMDYGQQLRIKEDEVLRLMAEKGVAAGKADPIEGCPSQYRYRNKMEYTFGDFEKGGPLTCGMHRKGNFMSITTVDSCQLVDEDFNRILSAAVEHAHRMGYSFYNKKSHKGLLRNLIIRKGVRTGQLLVNIVTSSEEGFDEEAFAKTVLDLKLDNKVVGILRTFNDSLADAVINQAGRILWGSDHYEEKLCGLKFNVSAFSFFQTNVEAAERLYLEALALIDRIDGKKVFDLYCGTGTISQIMALKAKEVIGIELVQEAAEAAAKNAALNGLDNCRFVAGDVFDVLSTIDDKPDVIVVDPPRAGIQQKALDKILGYGVEQILYISCNPKTLMDNLRYMEYCGYRCDYLKPFDNFPFTKHVETVCLLSKLNARQHIEVELNLDEMDLTAVEKKATYQEIKDYALEHSGLKVSSLYIAQVKQKCGIIERENYNTPKSEDSRRPQCPPEKEKAIMEVLKHFGMI